MSVLDDVLRVTRSGATPATTARTLGIDEGLVVAALDHWARRGALAPTLARRDAPCSSCDPGTPSDTPLPLACAGCPLARR
ncbi:MAG: hypothetical protein NVV70_15510 [Cellulomonas sp.]|uniref:Transcriptional regulator HTH-type FeoC domain-containing protein n=1 Tax=Cellulomonas gelida TaxID=1712 RepID=A0A4Y3KKI8_9CELL|nr:MULTISPECIES: hypothetical protein [Cellulomonas]KMM45483.1 hypothetical protein CWIS_10470 [Cellulomonas sp. A375-1]MCR6649465.1 hypothetical protein [Cellulomonas sp.]MCR6705436.1 hypothetical protein [Cellulomonas sp.]GEA84532.1 hypothetical protein CGE01nite_17830 [Cellulomonas gelida]GGL18041.1 hypothetical protein GCM10009774_05450 [Cellulomonas gelida]